MNLRRIMQVTAGAKRKSAGRLRSFSPLATRQDNPSITTPNSAMNRPRRDVEGGAGSMQRNQPPSVAKWTTPRITASAT